MNYKLSEKNKVKEGSLEEAWGLLKRASKREFVEKPGFYLRKAFIDLLRNYKSYLFGLIASIFAGVSLVVLFLIFTNITSFFDAEIDKAQINIFLTEEADLVQIEDLKNEISGVEGVVDARFISKDEALKEFTESIDFKGLNDLKKNPLPSSFEVKLQPGIYGLNKNFISDFKNQFASNKGIELIQGMDEHFAGLGSLSSSFGMLIAILAFLCLFVVCTVLSLISSLVFAKRKNEIFLMKSFGGSFFQFSSPILINITFLSILGSIIGILIGLKFYNFFAEKFLSSLNILFANFSLIQPSYQILFFLVVLISTFATISSYFSLSYYEQK